jgi:hypothetical protein
MRRFISALALARASLVTLSYVALSCAALSCASSTKPFGGGDGGADADPIFTQDSGPVGPAAEVYGETPSALYRVNPITKGVEKVGTFQSCVYVNDLALDHLSNLYGVTATQLFLIDTSTARCTAIATGAFPNSLSFVPAGTLDSVEALVGYEGADYVRIDVQTGKKTKVGDLGGGFVSSGDIVSVIGGKTFLSVKGNGCNDCLAEVDPKTGALVRNWGPLNHADVFGLAFWGGKLYGFAADSTLFEVALSMGSLTTTDIPIPNQPPGIAWAGAGSTTSAPLEVPK